MPLMTLDDALSCPLLFFGGKGGVGKTTLATARALESASQGSRTLLVSTDPAHSTGDALGLALGPDARFVTTNLWAMELDPAEEAERYLASVHDRLKDAMPPRLSGEVARQLDVARASPGAEEAALFDRFTRIIEEPGFERIIFDTAPSGQTLRLLSMPELMTSWIGALISQRRKVNSLGRMWRNAAGRAAGSQSVDRDVVLAALEERQGRFERTRLVLQDHRRTAFVFVTVAERLPVLETHRVVAALTRHGIPVGGLIVNQLLPETTTDPFLSRRKEREAVILSDIQERFRDWPLGYLPLLEQDPAAAGDLADLLGRLRTKNSEART